jgi:glyoxylase-like metal-dependent hydrolase (beta-lactamase superfamily II)/8-oxo-dGTP pyrophosphatase MutT (NUDIX family)
MTGSHYTPPADARKAASLLLLRDSEQGLQVLMLRRAEREGDMRSGAAVFPGGVLDPADSLAHPVCVGDGHAASDATASARLGLQQSGLDYWVAAVRETFEEVGLLLAVGHFDITQLQAWREKLQAGQGSMAAFCAEHGLQLDLRGMAYYSHWLTPPGHPKRFDTRFFAVQAPVGQVAVADEGEALELMWLTPRDALNPQRGLKLLPVTRRTLQDLGRHATAAAALAEAHARTSFALTMPRMGRTANGPRIVLPDERPYAEMARLDPLGRQDVWADLQPGRVVALSARILRITAPNAGPMTGPGTNTYLVGAAGVAGEGADDGPVGPVGPWTVIDPGPASEAHTRDLLAVLAQRGGAVARILVTHTHRDHSPGAAALALATGAPVWGRVASHPGWQDSSFAPQHQPQHGDRIHVGEACTLRVIHTPGHASNHLCYLLEEEHTLFTGDHVMQGSTVVINPPDGDMVAYMAALQALLDEDLHWLAPGHGFLVAEPHVVLRGLISHRLQREAKVVAALAALSATGPAALDALLAQVYSDTPAALHPVARRSLLAHLIKLQAEGRAVAVGGLDGHGGTEGADGIEGGWASAG